MQTYSTGTTRRLPAAGAGLGNALVGWLDRMVDACLAGVLLIAPLFMGGRGPIGQFVFVLLSCLAAIAWSARQTLAGGTKWRWSGVEWLLSLGVLLVVLQLTPLPQALLFKLSPAIKDLLPLWTQGSPGALSLGQWSTLSLTPEFTRGGLTIYLSYALLFMVLVQRLETVDDVGLLLKLVAVAAVLMAVIGLAQFFHGSTKFLWLYEHPSRSASKVVRGAFQNENHLAHFLSLGLGPLLWWLRHTRRYERANSSGNRLGARRQRSDHLPALNTFAQPLILLGLVLVALAGLLTFSRGGVLTMAIVLFASVVILYRTSLLDRRMTWILSTAATVNLLALLLFGYEPLTHQLGTVFQASSFGQLFDTRRDLWNSMCDAISHFYVTGTGVGSHSEVYPIYMEETYNVKFTHGESGYLPLLLETGVGGLLLMLLGIGVSVLWCVRTIVRPIKSGGSSNATMLVSCSSAILPSLIASIIHSIADFVWYIPACMVMTVAQLACACRIYQMSARSADSQQHSTESIPSGRYLVLPRGACATLLALLMVTGWALVSNRLGPALAALDWDSYLHHSMVRHGGTSTALEERERLAAMQRHLTTILRHSPRDAEAQLRLAAVYLKQFELAQQSAENSMDLSQIRDASLASAFPSKAAQDAWLTVALGDSRNLLDLAQAHARRAVALSPLQGLGYVQLADLSFLESPRAMMKVAYIDQAARVRPNSGQVLYIRGKEAALVGDFARAFQQWKKAFQQDPEIRQVIIGSLADQIPAEFFVTSFEPDTPVLGQLFQRYQASGRLDEAKWVGGRFVTALQKDAAAKSAGEAARCWQQAQTTYSWLGDAERALQCQQRAVELAPLDFDYRRALATLLSLQHRHAEAIQQFEWCLRRQPQREDLRNELADAKIQFRRNPAPPPVAAKSAGQRRS